MDRDSVKADHLEHDEGTIGLKSEGYTSGDVDTEFTEAEKKHIMRRLDRRLITTVGLMYCISLIDRTNLGAANIAGMAVELEMIGPVNGIRYVSGHGQAQPPPMRRYVLLTLDFSACSLS